jgi:hypothetical protein
MNVCRVLLAGSVILASLSLGAWRAAAQQQDDPEAAPGSTSAATLAPKPAARAYSSLLDADIKNEQDADVSQASADALRPDTRPLTGVQAPTLGTRDYRHSFWVPGFQYGGLFLSNNVNSPGPSSWYANNYFLGTLSVLENWRSSQLAVNYSGGRLISTDNTPRGGNLQELGVMQTFTSRRWQLQFLDQFSYLPEAAFGFGGSTTIGVPGTGGPLMLSSPGLGTAIAPTQNISGTVGPRYSNAFATQATYSMTSRSSITMAGAYGLLHFVDSANFSTDDEIGSVGYNYDVTRKNSIGVFYRFTAFHYSGNPQAVGDQIVNLAYERKITGRLAMELSGGPEFANFRVPVDNQTRKAFWSGSASLAYALRRGSMMLNYYHGVSGGSGLLVGSNGDEVTLAGNRQVGRLWNAIGSFGYAHNRNLASPNLLDLRQTFDSWYATAGLSRQLGPNALLSFGYTAHIQESAGPITCPSGVCGANGTQHQISLGFQWNARPFVLH